MFLRNPRVITHFTVREEVFVINVDRCGHEVTDNSVQLWPKAGRLAAGTKGVVSMSLITGLNCEENIHITEVRSIQFPQDKLSVV